MRVFASGQPRGRGGGGIHCVTGVLGAVLDPGTLPDPQTLSSCPRAALLSPSGGSLSSFSVSAAAASPHCTATPGPGAGPGQARCRPRLQRGQAPGKPAWPGRQASGEGQLGRGALGLQPPSTPPHGGGGGLAGGGARRGGYRRGEWRQCAGWLSPPRERGRREPDGRRSRNRTTASGSRSAARSSGCSAPSASGGRRRRRSPASPSGRWPPSASCSGSRWSWSAC